MLVAVNAMRLPPDFERDAPHTTRDQAVRLRSNVTYAVCVSQKPSRPCGKPLLTRRWIGALGWPVGASFAGRGIRRPRGSSVGGRAPRDWHPGPYRAASIFGIPTRFAVRVKL